VIGPEHLVLKSAAIAGLALCGYAVVLRRFADFVQPYRLSMAARGEAILASAPSPQRAGQTLFYLDHAFSGWVMACAVFVLPLAAARGILNHCLGKVALSPPVNRDDARMACLFFLSACASNPACGLLVAAECAIIAFVLVILSSPPVLMAVLAEFLRLEAALLGHATPTGSLANAPP
jgi:hypothetical protein